MPDKNSTDHCADADAVFALPSEQDSLVLAQRLASSLQPGMVVTLSGDLGAGKTTLVRAVLRALGVTGTIKSPTYALVESYRVPCEFQPKSAFESELGSESTLESNTASALHSPLQASLKTISDIYFYHFDFYRFVDPNEWLEAGFDEVFDGTAVVFIEWPERAGGLLPTPDLQLTLVLPEPPASGRMLTVQANTERGKASLKSLNQCLNQHITKV